MIQKIAYQLLEHIIASECFLKKEGTKCVQVVAMFNFKSDNGSYLRFGTKSDSKKQVLKNINPGLLFMQKNPDYFKSQNELVIFFVENILGKKIKLNSKKTHTKHVLKLNDLKLIASTILANFLSVDLKQSTSSKKIVKI